MPNRVATEDDWEDDRDDDEEYVPDDDEEEEYVPDDDDDDQTVACPHCDKPIYEESEQCPHCGKYISEEDTPSRKPWWIVLGAILCLFAVYLWVRS